MGRDQEKERFERRNELNQLRFEFEAVVRAKIGKVMEEIKSTSTTGQAQDDAQQQAINGLMSDFFTLKENLFEVHSAWSQVASKCFPQDEEEEEDAGHKESSVDYTEKHPFGANLHLRRK